MAIKQGIDFRNTSGYVTDPTDHTYDITSSSTANYPTTTPQGFNVGWESSGFGSGSQTRNRSTSIDARLAGCSFNTSSTDVLTYRFDLTAAGAHDIRVAAGDNAYARANLKVEVFDTTTSLGVLVNTGTTAGGRFRDAADAEYTAANWPGSNALVSKTFGTTICRFKIGNGSNQTFIAHLYVEGSAASGYTITCDAGSYTASGQDATLGKSRLIDSSAGSYTLSGQAATISRGLLLDGLAGSYSLSGQAATITHTPAGSYTITADSGSYILAGADAAIYKGRLLDGLAGSYSLSGQAATITYEAAAAYTISADAGSYGMSGQSAGISYSGAAADTIDGYWARQWEKIRRKKPKIQDVIELIKENPEIALAETREVVKLKYPDVSRYDVENNSELRRFIAKQLIILSDIKRIKEDEESDIEILLML
jgi:hypothetical protein